SPARGRGKVRPNRDDVGARLERAEVGRRAVANRPSPATSTYCATKVAPYRHDGNKIKSAVSMGDNQFDGGGPDLLDISTHAPGPAGSLPFTDAMLRERPS